MEITVGELIDALSRFPANGVIHFGERTFYQVKRRGKREDGREIIAIEFNEVYDADFEENAQDD